VQGLGIIGIDAGQAAGSGRRLESTTHSQLSPQLAYRDENSSTDEFFLRKTAVCSTALHETTQLELW